MRLHRPALPAERGAAFPGQGAYITQVWRLKQLEYSWLRSLMGRYEDFWTITRDSLAYTLGTLGHELDEELLDRIAGAYNTLSPFPDARDAVAQLAGLRLAVLSNASPGMLARVMRHSELDNHVETTISVHAKRTFKPDPRAYELVEESLGVTPSEVAFISSNGFDIAGAKSFGFKVVRVERSTSAGSSDKAAQADTRPAAMYAAVRTRHELLGYGPDLVVSSLLEIPDAISTLGAADA